MRSDGATIRSYQAEKQHRRYSQRENHQNESRRPIHAMTSRQHFLTTGCATAPYPTSSSGSPEVVRGDDVSKVSRLEQGRLWRERFAALSGLAHRGTHSRGEATFIPRTRPEMWAAPNPELGPTKVDAEWMGEEVDAAAG